VKNFLYFIFIDGFLLVSLFFMATFFIAITKESVSSEYFSSERLKKQPLGLGNFYAAMIGAVTPFCSCSTIPVFSAMVSTGVRFGIAITFLMASPLVNEAVIILMFTLFGIKHSLTFLTLAIFFSIIMGIFLDKLKFEAFLKEDSREKTEVPGFIESTENVSLPFRAKVKFASLIGRHEVKRVFPHILIGVLIGGAIYGFVPDDYIMSFGNETNPQYLIVIMALIGIPLYVDMSAALPIAFALTEKGIGFGPVMALLITSAGTSIPELILLNKIFKTRLLLTFVVLIVVAAISIGFFFEYL